MTPSWLQRSTRSAGLPGSALTGRTQWSREAIDLLTSPDDLIRLSILQEVPRYGAFQRNPLSETLAVKTSSHRPPLCQWVRFEGAFPSHTLYKEAGNS